MKLLENLPDNGIAKRQFTIQFTDLFFSFSVYHSFAKRNSSLSLSLSLSLRRCPRQKNVLLSFPVWMERRAKGIQTGVPRAGFLTARDVERHVHGGGLALMTRGNGKRGRKIKAFASESTRSRVWRHSVPPAGFICLRSTPTRSVSWLRCRAAPRRVFARWSTLSRRCNPDASEPRFTPELTRNPRKKPETTETTWFHQLLRTSLLSLQRRVPFDARKLRDVSLSRWWPDLDED